MKKHVFLVLLLIPISLFSQDDFISMRNSILSSTHLGKSVLYGSNNERLIDTLYKTIELKPSRIRETNYNTLIDDINNHPNIIYLRIKKNLFSDRTKSELEILPLSKLNNIVYFELWGSKLNCSYEQLFKELNLMPKLEYLVLPKFESYGIDTIQNFQKLIIRIKGLELSLIHI